MTRFTFVGVTAAALEFQWHSEGYQDAVNRRPMKVFTDHGVALIYLRGYFAGVAAIEFGVDLSTEKESSNV